MMGETRAKFSRLRIFGGIATLAITADNCTIPAIQSSGTRWFKMCSMRSSFPQVTTHRSREPRHARLGGLPFLRAGLLRHAAPNEKGQHESERKDSAHQPNQRLFKLVGQLHKR